MKIIITKRVDDFHACMEGDPRIWGRGTTINEAIGDLIRTHMASFNLELVFPVDARQETDDGKHS